MNRPATREEVRAYYTSQGYDVRVYKHDGHIVYRRREADLGTPWLEGRWLSEYGFNEECNGVYLK